MTHITFSNAHESFEIETPVVFAVIDNGEKGTKELCAIDGASPIEVAAALGTLMDLVDTISEKYPYLRILVESYRQARDIEKEEGKTDD